MLSAYIQHKKIIFLSFRQKFLSQNDKKIDEVTNHLKFTHNLGVLGEDVQSN